MFAHDGKTGHDDGETKYEKKPKEILTTSPAMVVEKKVTIWETENDLHRKNSKRLQMKPEKFGTKPHDGGG